MAVKSEASPPEHRADLEFRGHLTSYGSELSMVSPDIPYVIGQVLVASPDQQWENMDVAVRVWIGDHGSGTQTWKGEHYVSREACHLVPDCLGPCCVSVLPAEQSQTEKSGPYANVPQPYEVSQARSQGRQIQIQQPQREMQAEQSAGSQMTGESKSTNAEQMQLAKSAETPAQSEGHPPEGMAAEVRVDRKSEQGSVGTGTNGTNGPSSSSSPLPVRWDFSTPVGKWYEGGTLHRKTALDWQTASFPDKLATCSASSRECGRRATSNRPSHVPSPPWMTFVPYAQQLVDFLDAAFKPSPDPEENRRLFANQTVAGFAAMGMVTMGWTK